jgi:hypothetical protein
LALRQGRTWRRRSSGSPRRRETVCCGYCSRPNLSPADGFVAKKLHIAGVRHWRNALHEAPRWPRPQGANYALVDGVVEAAVGATAGEIIPHYDVSSPGPYLAESTIAGTTAIPLEITIVKVTVAAMLATYREVRLAPSQHGAASQDVSARA